MSLYERRPPRRRIVFMLTPLVDVMFLLLIFFMLSSQTSPYSLLEIMAQGAPGQQAQPPATPPAQSASKAEMLVSIARGYVRFNGAKVEMADLKTTIERFKAEGIRTAVVTTGEAATVQDVVSVLVALENASLDEMRLVTPAAAP